MSSRSLNDLDSRMLPLVREVQSRCALAGVPTTIITTLRSMEEQKQAVAHGVSWTLKGMHLAHPPENKSLAVDLAPTELLIRAAHPGATAYEKNWSPQHPDWWVIAEAGVAMGLRSGMDWSGVGLPPVGQTRPKWDPGHLEWREPPAPVT